MVVYVFFLISYEIGIDIIVFDVTRFRHVSREFDFEVKEKKKKQKTKLTLGFDFRLNM